MAYIILFSKWVLPGDDAADDLNSALYVPQGSHVEGKSAKASGLQGGKLQLNGFSRKNTPAVPFSSDMVLQAGDVIYVTGEGSVTKRLPCLCHCLRLRGSGSAACVLRHVCCAFQPTALLISRVNCVLIAS
jgi:hypothetical protein